jgi:hypothetical protein
VWPGFIWLRIGTGGRLEHGDQPLSSGTMELLSLSLVTIKFPHVLNLCSGYRFGVDWVGCSNIGYFICFIYCGNYDIF